MKIKYKLVVVVISVISICILGSLFKINKKEDINLTNKSTKTEELSKEDINLTNKSSQSKNEESSNKNNTSTQVWGASNLSEIPKSIDSEKIIDIPSEDSLSIDNIIGFTRDSKTVVGGINLPYEVKGTSFVIESIGSYSGPFVEDGSNKYVDNILSIVVKNNSDKMIQYGEINININNDKAAVFKISNLPSKTSALVCESTGKITYSKDDQYVESESVSTLISELSLHEDKIDIVQENNKLSITNKTNSKLSTVYVYYKYAQEGGVYLGGITYRTKFEDIGPKKTIEENTAHFTKNTSKIVMVDYIN